MIDRTTKLLLAAIAIALFLTAVLPLIRPQNEFTSILEGLKKAGSEVRVRIEVEEGAGSTKDIKELRLDDEESNLDDEEPN